MSRLRTKRLCVDCTLESIIIIQVFEEYEIIIHLRSAHLLRRDQRGDLNHKGTAEKLIGGVRPTKLCDTSFNVSL